MSSPSVIAASLDTLSAAQPDTAVCRHCGDPCRRTHITTASGTFCCAGCASVFDLLAAYALTDYYTCDVNPGRSQMLAADRPADRFALLDDPDVAGRFIARLDAGTVRAVWQVPALHCASCLWLLEQLWRFDPAIVRSEANLLHRTVRVDFQPERTSLRRVAELLASLGYEPVIDGERPAAGIATSARRLYLRIGVAGFAFGNVMLFSIPRYANGAPLEPVFQRLFDTLNLLFAVPVLLYSASDYFRGAWQSLRGRTVTLDIPIALGLAVLFGRSAWEIATGAGEGFLDSFAGLVFFLLIGRLFQRKAFDHISFDRTMRSFLPLSVAVERDRRWTLAPIETLQPGDVIRIRPGEVVPADAILLDAAASVDYAFVTGEQTPSTVREGHRVHAGGRAVGHSLRLAVARPVSQSSLSRLWTHPVFGEARAPWLTSVLGRFAWWFTVSALVLASAGAWYWWPDGRQAAAVATAVLIIACPCAFTLAAPITLGTAMGVLGRAGLYMKDAAVALELSRVTTVAFDKTGTLTTAAQDADVVSIGFTPDDWARVRALAAHSLHPVSRAIAGHDAPTPHEVTGVEEFAGRGIRGQADGLPVVLGSASFVGAATGVRLLDGAGLTWASVNGSAPGAISLVTPERPGMSTAATAVGQSCSTWLLSGDHGHEAPRWAPVFGDRMRFRLSPEDKLEVVRDQQAAGARVLMVGDGLNDAGALAAADVGLAVSDDTACLVPACDAVIRGDRLARLPLFLAYARRARRVIALCFTVSILYNTIGLGLALSGALTPLATAILMPVSSLTIVGLGAGLMRGRTATLVAA
jgi:Cu+-exporting ATPase